MVSGGIACGGVSSFNHLQYPLLNPSSEKNPELLNHVNVFCIPMRAHGFCQGAPIFFAKTT